jgi:hypothetical protein
MVTKLGLRHVRTVPLGNFHRQQELPGKKSYVIFIFIYFKFLLGLSLILSSSHSFNFTFFIFFFVFIAKTALLVSIPTNLPAVNHVNLVGMLLEHWQMHVTFAILVIIPML